MSGGVFYSSVIQNIQNRYPVTTVAMAMTPSLPPPVSNYQKTQVVEAALALKLNTPFQDAF